MVAPDARAGRPRSTPTARAGPCCPCRRCDGALLTVLAAPDLASGRADRRDRSHGGSRGRLRAPARPRRCAPCGPNWSRTRPVAALYSLDGVAEELLYVSGPALVGGLMAVAPAGRRHPAERGPERGRHLRLRRLPGDDRPPPHVPEAADGPGPGTAVSGRGRPGRGAGPQLRRLCW
ncbi:hypothetical protein LT493_19775 [Streptomyces tricolor]|nr:hypothetical protein [Streptomyces tricolor]